MSLDAALEEARAAVEASELVYQEIADQHGVDRTMLSRRHRGNYLVIEQLFNYISHSNVKCTILPVTKFSWCELSLLPASYNF